MKSKFIVRNDSSRLLLIFAGWGMDWRPFASLSRPGYDILVIWDYRDLLFDWKPLFRYDEICLIAWSMGVFAASITIHEIAPRITMRVAVNGTLRPIDDQTGIPPAIWSGTYNSLSPSTWRKFQRRMCTSAEQFGRFSEIAPKRTIADLTEELASLEGYRFFHPDQITAWDMAIIGRHDGIFPPDNQSRAWRGKTSVRILDSGHLPDFGMIVDRLLIDKDLVGRRFSGVTDSYGSAAVVQQSIANGLMKRFDLVAKSVPIIGTIIEIGPGPDGLLTRLYYPRVKPMSSVRLWDIADIDTSAFAPGARFEKIDAEVAIKRVPSASVAFIFSASTIQWFNSPREFIKECERVLVPGGYLVLSTFVHGNLEELNNLIGKGLQLLPMQSWQSMFSPEMNIEMIESNREELTFDSPRDVLEHLKATGVNALSFGRNPVTVARRVLRDYPVGEDGKYHLTYRPLYLIARKITEQ